MKKASSNTQKDLKIDQYACNLRLAITRFQYWENPGFLTQTDHCLTNKSMETAKLIKRLRLPCIKNYSLLSVLNIFKITSPISIPFHISRISRF